MVSLVLMDIGHADMQTSWVYRHWTMDMQTSWVYEHETVRHHGFMNIRLSDIMGVYEHETVRHHGFMNMRLSDIMGV